MSIAAKRAGERRSSEEVAVLVSGAGHGDQRAWNALVEEFGPLVWTIARAHRLGDADAADVAQLTWLRLIEHLNDLKDPSRVGAWLATTARRECLGLLRHGRRNVLTSDDVAFNRESRDAGLLLSERDEALWRSFSRLQGRDRALLQLLTGDNDASYEEISAALDMPVGSIGPTRARALERLRRELERDGTLALLAA